MEQHFPFDAIPRVIEREEFFYRDFTELRY